MATKLLTFLYLFRPRAPTTSTALNSWATVCLWRRYLQQYEENDDNHNDSENDNTTANVREQDTEVRAHEMNNNDTCNNESLSRTSEGGDMIRSDWARNELHNFRRHATSVSRSNNSTIIDPCRHQSMQPQQQQYRTTSMDFNNSNTTTTPITPSTIYDHPDLQVNGMFLPQ